MGGGLLELRDDEHAVRGAHTNTDLNRTGTDHRHRFPIIGLVTLLNSPELKPR